MLSVFGVIYYYISQSYNRILVNRQINTKPQSLKAFSRKWYLKNVLSGKRLSGKVTVRETSDNHIDNSRWSYSSDREFCTPRRPLAEKIHVYLTRVL